MSQVLHFDLTVDEANVILRALGRMPFTEVYALIGKIHEQANAQIANGAGKVEMPGNHNGTEKG